MTEERLKAFEKAIDGHFCKDIDNCRFLPLQELIDEVRFLQAALADARKELDRPDAIVVRAD